MNNPIAGPANEMLNLIKEKLGSAPINFRERFEHIKENKTLPAASVLIPLSFEENTKTNEPFALQLIKRSDFVSQAGDLSGPGGMIEPIDYVLRYFVVSPLLPIMRGGALRYARKRDRHTFRHIALFLAGAIRESWEEIRLSPFDIRFLGPLPAYKLHLFEKTIFPLVVCIRKKRSLRPNREVEKVVEIPFSSLLTEENYGLYVIRNPDQLGSEPLSRRGYPCFIHKDCDGGKEILWGATFNIVMSLLKTVFDFDLPETHRKRKIEKTLPSDYFTGNHK
jgi:8-oxo-dGTP pyrophosphatase MutT (NUDIX family)